MGFAWSGFTYLTGVVTGLYPPLLTRFGYLLVYFDLEVRMLEQLEHPFGPKVLPMP
jgi:hypothetical protein